MAEETLLNATGVVDEKKWRAAADKVEKTGSETHVAVMNGYAAGAVVEEGQFVPADTPVSDIWMKRVKASERKAVAAAAEAVDPKPKDVDLTKLGVPALQAMCATEGINVEQDGKPLTKAELIAAYNAHIEKDAG